jgi:hypothetical protein
VYDWNNPFQEGWTQVENIRKLHLLQEKIWQAFFEIHKASYSSIFW